MPGPSETEPLVDLLFVYGSLRSEFENPFARKLRANATSAGRATVAGSIFQVDWHPAFRTEPSGKVHGELYRLNDPPALFKELDDYEGAEFERSLIEVSTGEIAWIYRYLPAPSPAARIESGDFLNP